MTGREQIIAAFDSWAASKNPKYRSTDDSVSDRSLREAFAAGAASRDTEIAELVELYEQALTASWPDGAIGDAFDFWNAARKVRKQ